jgi:hypothetical protein
MEISETEQTHHEQTHHEQTHHEQTHHEQTITEQNQLKPNQTKQSLLNLKNPIFMANSVDPLNGKFVKEIRAQKIMKDTQFKQNRIKFDIVWQYMRDRHRQSVESIYKKHKGKLLHVIYSGDPVIYDFIYE